MADNKEGGSMRALFIAMGIVVGLLSGCARFPYVNLRQPIYLVTDDSFFAGCEVDLQTQAWCRKQRLEQIRAGISQWLRYFMEQGRPSVYILASRQEVPSGTVNTPIHLRIDGRVCGDDDPEEEWACYLRRNFWSEPEIVFAAPTTILQHIVAHEFGHALGLDHYESSDNSCSIMTAYTIEMGANVWPEDLERVCEVHQECPLMAQASEYADIGFVY